MYVHWEFIRARLQFLAEALDEYYDVSVFYKKPYKKRRLDRRQSASQLRLNELFKLPFGSYWSAISKINTHLIRSQLKKDINQFDIIWLTLPELYPLVAGIIPDNAKLIYDCMDDVLEFPKIKSNKKLSAEIKKLEKELILKSDLVFVSSDNLKNKLLERYKTYDKKIFVVNNAIFIDQNEKPEQLSEDIIDSFQKAKFKITYIGTISEWFDFKLILESLKKFKEITYFLFGPTEIKIPKHKRIIHYRPVEHKYIFEIMKNADLLIMPFKLNELIFSVDPVKLYEYIYSGQPCAAIEYGETLKFKDYIYLYKNKEEYYEILGKLVNHNLSPKKSRQESRLFAENNTWKQRAEFITQKINSLYHE
jgi:glycosyltransferase involved in cell wall biosynthesis